MRSRSAPSSLVAEWRALTLTTAVHSEPQVHAAKHRRTNKATILADQLERFPDDSSMTQIPAALAQAAILLLVYFNHHRSGESLVSC
jgi:hypothetical protein